ncbi:MAG: phosphatase PAP2 family protein [Deltaproteobacteria bacterium]|nr:phosphatase PAP2 family protein [Deltaproteobacteria bacterium]
MKAASRTRSSVAAVLRRALATLGLPELILCSFQVFVLTALLFREATDELNRKLLILLGLFVIYVLQAQLLRARPGERRPHVRRAARRLTTLIFVLLTYFQLRWIIPALHPGSFDSALAEIDLAIFHAPVAALLQPYLDYATVEWFGFFYWSYFYVIGGYTIAHCIFERNEERFAGYGTGIVAVHAWGGWLGYFLLPGFGPYVHHAASLEPLEGGTFLAMSGTAYSWGALRDIFPSLHTAVMSFITIHAFRRWGVHWLYKPVAILYLFWTLQIVIATLYLRWHYTVDLAAGLTVAFVWGLASDGLARRWGEFRKAQGELDPWF